MAENSRQHMLQMDCPVPSFIMTLTQWQLVARWSQSVPTSDRVSTGIGDRQYLGSVPGVGYLSRYVTSHPGQLSLAIPLWVGAMTTSQNGGDALRLGGKGMVCVWFVSRYGLYVGGR